MKLGIVGLPNVGKSTLFNSLTKAGALSANYPFATIDPNVGIVSVPDERIVKLGELYHTKKVTPATIEFVDIAGLVKGAMYQKRLERGTFELPFFDPQSKQCKMPYKTLSAIMSGICLKSMRYRKRLNL